jgi:hypothetical protein
LLAQISRTTLVTGNIQSQEMSGEGAPLVTSVTHGTRIDLLFTMSDNTRATDKRQMAKAKCGEVDDATN